MYSEEAELAIGLAPAEARRTGQHFVGTDHLLLGLLAANGSTARLLKNLGLTLAKARKESIQIAGRGTTQPPDELPYTPKAKKALETAEKEAFDRGNTMTGAIDILDALLLDKGVAFRILTNLEIDVNKLESQLSGRTSKLGYFTDEAEFRKALKISESVRADVLSLRRSVVGASRAECIERLGQPDQQSESTIVYEVHYVEAISGKSRLTLTIADELVVAYSLVRTVDIPSIDRPTTRANRKKAIK